MNVLGDIPGHTGLPVQSLEERESMLAAWVSRARGSMQGAQKGSPQGGGHVGFALWASKPSRFGDRGDADLFLQGPPDGAHKDSWSEHGFR